MVLVQQASYHYDHEYFFEFKGEKHRVHSVVRLTEEGRTYMGFARREVILTEVYFDRHIGRMFWKYQGKDWAYNIGIRDKSTDTPPDKIIDEVIESASAEYASREMFGVDSPCYQSNGTKHTKKDWEIPEVRRAWIIFIVVFIAVAIFKDWYIQWIIRIVASLIFGKYRKAFVDAHTTYTHDEDDEILRQKYYALYGIKPNIDTEDVKNEQDSPLLNKTENKK